MASRTARRPSARRSSTPAEPLQAEGGIPVAAETPAPQPAPPTAPPQVAGTEAQRAAEDSRAYHNGQVRTLADLKRQPKVLVSLPWTEQDEENLRAGNPMPYLQHECVGINGVEWWIKRGEYVQVPLSVAEVLVHARMLPPEALPEGNKCREQAIADRAERRQRASRTERWNRIIQGQAG